MGMDTASTSSLGYGKQITVGPFRCTLASAGITCVVITSGTGFMINASRSSGASVESILVDFAGPLRALAARSARPRLAARAAVFSAVLAPLLRKPLIERTPGG